MSHPSSLAEKMFPLLLNNLQDYALFMTDLEGIILCWTPGVERVLGYEAAEFTGQNADIIFSAADRTGGVPGQEREKASRCGQAEVKRFYRRKDGSRLWSNGQLIALRDTAGQVQGFAQLLRDETQSKIAEDTLRDREARQTFLLRLNDALRTLSESDEVLLTASRVLGEHLGASRVGYAQDQGDGFTILLTHNYTHDVPSIEGSYCYEDYGPGLLRDLLAGRTVVRPDIANDSSLTDAEKQAHAALQLGATLNKPLLKAGRLVAVLFVHYKEAHSWSEEELLLLDEVAERTWAAVERARAEEALRQSTRQISQILESITDIFYALDKDMVFTYLNSKAEEVWGKSRQELLGKTLLEAFPQAVGSESYQMHLKVLAERQPIHFEAVSAIIGRWISVHIFPSTGNGLSVYFHDIQDRKEAEAALRQSEEKYRTLFDSMDEGYCIIEMIYDAGDEHKAIDWRFLQVNRAFERNNGLSNAEGKTIRELAPDIEPKWIEIYEQVAQSGEPLRFEEDSVALGRTFSLYAFRFGQPLEHRVAVIFTDITQSKKAETALTQSEERLRIAIEAAEMATWDWDLERNLVWWNEQHFHILGLEPRENPVDPQEFFKHIHPEDAPRVKERLEQALKNDIAFSDEFCLMRADGESRWMAGYGRAVERVNDRPSRMVGVMMDITARKQAEEQLQRAHEELEARVVKRTRELAQALEQLQNEVEQRREAEVARAALVKRIVNAQEEERGRISRELHDNMGQSLTAVMLGLQQLEMQIGHITRGQSKEEVPQLEKLRALVDNLLDVAHRQAWELRPAELDSMGVEVALGQYIHDWSQNSGVVADYQSLGWEERRPDKEVETVLYRVAQEALTNVARHAKATPVSVVLKLSDGAVSAIVEDNGRGFNPEKIGGRLGVVGIRERLAIVGGTLDIESSTGSGTTVFARIPLQSPPFQSPPLQSPLLHLGSMNALLAKPEN